VVDLLHVECVVIYEAKIEDRTPRVCLNGVILITEFALDLLPHRVGFRKGASLPLFVGLHSTLNGHLYFEGVRGTNIGPNAL